MTFSGLLAYSNLVLKGICSHLQWWRMLNRPILGINSAIMEKILRSIAKVPQTNIMNFVVMLQNPFSSDIKLICAQTQLIKLHAIEITRNSIGSRPNNVWSEMVSRPPVVAVFVLASNRMKICTHSWAYSSIPKISYMYCRKKIMTILIFT